MIRIGANPICWSNDDMVEIGGDISLEQCLSEARDIGLEGMEKGNKFPTTAPELKAKLAEYGLVFVSGWYSTFLLERDADAEFAAAQAGSASCARTPAPKVLVTCECTRTVHGDEVRAAIDAASTDRRRMVRLPAADDPLRGARARISASSSSTTTTWARSSRPPTEVDRFMAGAGPAVKLLLDTGHITWARRRRRSRREDLRRPDRPRPHQGRPPGRRGEGAGRGLVVPQFGARRRLHRARRRLDRLCRRVQGAAQLFGLGGDRGRAGSRRRPIRRHTSRWATTTSSAFSPKPDCADGPTRLTQDDGRRSEASPTVFACFRALALGV